MTDQENRLPNFFVVGAGKCGTTSLYHYLDQHPEVYMSPIKEPHHFGYDIQPKDFSQEYLMIERGKKLVLDTYLKNPEKKIFSYYVKDWNHYIQLFKFAKNEKAVGEISNSYLYSSVAAQEIGNKIKDPKIIIILRNPVDRAYSHYTANLRDGKTSRNFMDELYFDRQKTRKGWGISHLYFEMGLYYEQVKRYFDLFSPNQIKIFLYDDLKKNPDALAAELFSFLEISPFKTNTSVRHNESLMPKNKYLLRFISKTGIKRKIFRNLPDRFQKKIKSKFFLTMGLPPIKKEDYQELVKLYSNDILALQILINKDLSHWIR